ncbi:glycoside hydrolase family 97 protein [Galbibacter sp. PAP.153]|uniref:glycoside hydrolase family 97 protein n=1 Tax=Galbibacter sp. PAP.153 TaxID=3104623 RepID=UPI003009451B
MKTLLCCLFGWLFIGSIAAQQNLSSPNTHIKVAVTHEKGLNLKIYLNGNVLVENISPKMDFASGKTFGQGKEPNDSTVEEISNEITAIVPTKSSRITDHYNLLTLNYDDFNFEVRAYNNGVAYRFVSKLKGNDEVMDEGMDVSFPSDYQCYLPEEKQLISHFENYYTKTQVSEIKPKTIAALPTLFTNKRGESVSITEADLYDYPNLFLEKSDKGFKSLFPNYVLSTEPLKEDQDRLEKIKEAAPYIAKTSGARTFPWRLFMISENDKQIVENNLVYQLASPLKIKDTSWIKPGKVAWDWWNANNVYNVPFKSGLNTQTYKYYIDFAAEFGLEYIILDEGWSKSTLNVMEPNPDIDMESLTAYAKEKNVGIILWSLWRPLDSNMEVLLTQYEKWGIKGVKVDFIQRADQYVTNFYERLAKTAAEHRLLVDYHGGMKPSGMRRAYPNIINYEAVKGLENNKWTDKITPEHDLTLPFTRMTAGVMDYTPGGMDNAHEDNYAVRFNRPMTLGTRAHQMALYIMFEAPLQMLADSPSNYYNNPESTGFISKIPTTWEDTKVIEAKISDYLVLARKNKDIWYVAGLTDETPRDFKIDMSFLDSKRKYNIVWFEDGINSDKVAKDYSVKKQIISSTDELDISMHSGGGWIGIISPE